MKTKNAASRPIPTAAQLKKQRVRRVSCIILRILLVLSTILFTWITCWGCGLGWISRARAGSNWPMSFVGYGQMLLVGSGLLTLGTVLVLLCRKNWLNWAAAGSAAGGVVLCLLLFSIGPDNYISYSLNRMFDTGVGVVMSLLINYLLPRERLEGWIEWGRGRWDAISGRGES